MMMRAMTRTMPKPFRRIFTFHGAFLSKTDAVEREAETPNSFILPIRVRGQKRFAVVSRLDGWTGRKKVKRAYLT